MTLAAWNALLWFCGATYVTLFAFGWLPGSLSRGHDHPAVKRLRVLGPLGMFFMLIQFLRALP